MANPYATERWLRNQMSLRDARILELELALQRLLAFHDPDSCQDQKTDMRLRLEAEAAWAHARVIADKRKEYTT
jgi:hypothetical protein